MMGRRILRGEEGMTLIEVVISVLVLGIGFTSAIPCLLAANNIAAANRNQNAALALCRDRIDQMVAAKFSPPAAIPSFFGNTWPISASETVTNTETIQLYSDQSGAGLVTGTRTTRVALADASLNLVRVTVLVSYNYRGKNFSRETYTLRVPD
jgi:prepilin-type N-terminal cleavage/methylation domain-containing protein